MAATTRYEHPGHLPNLRAGRTAPEPHTLPRQRRGITPQMVGRYPDYDVLENADSWDEVTREVVLKRLDHPGPLRFFSEDEEPTVRAFCDTVTAQDSDPRVPVVAMVDRKLAERRFDGYRYEGMPDDDQTWHTVIRGLDEVAQQRYGARFASLDREAREAICKHMAQGGLEGGVWDCMSSKRAWSVCSRAIVDAFYSHPWAWNEIGFGGPAYPLGFMRLGPGMREPHERPEALHDDPVLEAEAGTIP